MKIGDVETSARVIQFGGVIRVYLDAAGELASKIDAEIKKALLRGETVTENGVSRWYEYREVLDTTKQGSEMYEWDKTGEKVRAERILATKTADGEVTKAVIGKVWRAWE